MKRRTIDEVEAEFRRWQKSRKGRRSRVPEQLRRLALDLREAYTDERICEALGIYRSYLRRWQQGPEANACKPVPVVRHRAKPQATTNRQTGFIEVSGFPDAIARQPDEGALATVEWRRADGARMRVSAALCVFRIEELAKRFLADAAVR